MITIAVVVVLNSLWCFFCQID